MTDPLPHRPQTLDEILPGPLPDTPAPRHTALGVWEETQRVMAGMPRGDLMTRVAYLEGQTGLDQANIDRLVHHETRRDFATRTDVPGRRPRWLDQAGDAIGPLAQGVAHLAGNPDYAGQDQGGLMHNLATGWRPVAAPDARVPSVADRFGYGVMHGLHSAGAGVLGGVAAVARSAGLGAESANVHGWAQARRDAAAAYPAPGPDADLLQRAAWGVGDFAGQWEPGLAVGGAPALAARGLGMGLAARGALGLAGGAAYAGTGTAGRAHDNLLAQGVPPRDAADRALGLGGLVGLSNLITPRMPATAMGTSLPAKAGAFAYNEGKAALMENMAEELANAWRNTSR